MEVFPPHSRSAYHEGVQFHPESVLTRRWSKDQMIRNFTWKCKANASLGDRSEQSGSAAQ